MAKNAVGDWDSVAANNSDIGGIALGEGVMAISSVNDAIRTIMSQIAAAGFITATSAAFSDAGFSLTDDGDATKIWKVQLSGLATATTRTVTMPDVDGTLILNTTPNFADAADTTKKAAFSLSGITTGNTRTMTIPDVSGTLALLDASAQVVTGGARVTSDSLGTITSGTLTLDPGNRPLQHYTNNGAHTLAPGSNTGSILLDVTNGASAGAITITGWTKVVGAFDATNANKFRCHASIGNAGSLLTIQALQ